MCAPDSVTAAAGAPSGMAKPSEPVACAERAVPLWAQAAAAWVVSFLLCGLPWIATALLAPERFADFPRTPHTEGLWASPSHWSLLLTVAIAFEPLTFLIHKYVMHGGLWWVHEDHHHDTAYSRAELYKNDFFPLVFAVPSSGVACWASVGILPRCTASVVLGALLYGAAYMYLHEEIFHRRFGLPGSAAVRRHPYIKRLATAHGMHHGSKEASKMDVAFGFLYAPPRFEACRVRHFRRGEEETLLDYYGPLFGRCKPCDKVCD
mmetsp:Transcript_36324/g.104580  ORF Transcript_36324/g.104580 Transcript_36324/m.104580 type:complete len:264 (-) Transcript_36324:290-1081(-)